MTQPSRANRPCGGLCLGHADTPFDRLAKKVRARRVGAPIPRAVLPSCAKECTWSLIRTGHPAMSDSTIACPKLASSGQEEQVVALKDLRDLVRLHQPSITQPHVTREPFSKALTISPIQSILDRTEDVEVHASVDCRRTAIAKSRFFMRAMRLRKTSRQAFLPVLESGSLPCWAASECRRRSPLGSACQTGGRWTGPLPCWRRAISASSSRRSLWTNQR